MPVKLLRAFFSGLPILSAAEVVESARPPTPEKATLGSKGPVDAVVDRVGVEVGACGAGVDESREGLLSRMGVVESGGVLRNLLGAVMEEPVGMWSDEC